MFTSVSLNIKIRTKIVLEQSMKTQVKYVHVISESQFPPLSLGKTVLHLFISVMIITIIIK